MEGILAIGFEQGLLYSFLVLGVFFTFRVLDFPDLTVDGSLVLGAGATAILVTNGVSVFLATGVGVIAGACAGVVTGLIHILLKSGSSDTNYGPKLIAGILTTTALYSINLRVMGRSNVPLLHEKSMFDHIGDLISVNMTRWSLVLGLLVIALLVKLVLDWFLHTELGLAMQALGDNEQMIRSLGVNTNRVRILGLAIANGLVALTGGLVAQQQGYADIGMGFGALVAGLGGVIIGEVVFGMRSIRWVLFSVMAGSIVYRILVAVGLRIDWIRPTDLKLLTAVLVLIALATPTIRSRVVRS